MGKNFTKLYIKTILVLVVLGMAVTGYGQLLTSGSCIGTTSTNDRGDEVTLLAVEYFQVGSETYSSWYYCIFSDADDATDGVNDQAISHVVFQLGICATVVDDQNYYGTWSGDVENINPSIGGVTIDILQDPNNPDNTTGINGIKFDEGFEPTNPRYFYFTLNEPLAITAGMTLGVKAGGPNDGSFNITGVCGPSTSCTLPVELTRFNAVAESSDVRLDWETATETNNDYFQVEHSTDGAGFTALDFVPGHGDSQAPISYSYAHKNAPPGINYYRLKQVDYDGAFEYSDVVTAQVAGNGELRVFPNPARDELRLTSGLKEQLGYTLFDATGRLVRQGSLAPQGDRIDLSGLPGGVYFLHVENERGEVLARERVLRME